MDTYAMFRLPFEDNYTEIRQTEGKAEEVTEVEGLDGRSGFVLAPFAPTEHTPLLLIRPDSVETRPVEKPTPTPGKKQEPRLLTDNHDSYRIDFANFHSRLASGEFKKIVLARQAIYETANTVTPKDLFFKACALYPRMFVALVSTPLSGTWLAATPEILLDGQANHWSTMALAGTIKLDGKQLAFDTPPQKGKRPERERVVWSLKNQQEQRHVATFITECLEQFTNDFIEDGPYTARAGNLVHLRSDFRFTLDNDRQLGRLIRSLYPTPAVCGLPKELTYRFIRHNEAEERKYYSGFMGPLHIAESTHLYVTLRCMEMIDRQRFRLYAGGGLLIESDEESEWKETMAKMETMKQCLQTRSTSTY